MARKQQPEPKVIKADKPETRGSLRHKTSINLSDQAITMIDEILKAEGGFSRSAVIERAIRAFHERNDAVKATRKIVHEAR